jgi:hypothetical protein
VGSANETIHVNAEASVETQRKLLRHSLRISQPDAIQAIREDGERDKDGKRYLAGLFKKSTLLKSYYPLWLTNGKARLPREQPKLIITLDPQLGLVIEREGKQDDTIK